MLGFKVLSIFFHFFVMFVDLAFEHFEIEVEVWIMAQNNQENVCFSFNLVNCLFWYLLLHCMNGKIQYYCFSQMTQFFTPFPLFLCDPKNGWLKKDTLHYLNIPIIADLHLDFLDKLSVKFSGTFAWIWYDLI